MARILVVDDDVAMQDSLKRLLSREGHAVMCAGSVEAGIAHVARSAPDLVLTDLCIGPESGLDVIRRARALSSTLRIIAITAFGSVDAAVEAMRYGADDFIEKPFETEKFLARLERALEPARLAGEVAYLRRANQALREELEVPAPDDGLVGASPAIERVRALIARVAPSSASVLIQGESGTGKELVARAIHRASPRAERPFVAFDGSALAEGIIESELFGHEKGAFTGADRRRIGRFELAHQGTLFLDEIGDLAPGLQVKLLRVLQERTFQRVGGTDAVSVDVRVIAATNRDLQAAMREHRFRQDLFYRLNVVTITLPPLRERVEDIPSLVQFFLARYGGSRGRTPQVGEPVMSMLCGYSWPGNVRQLENVVHRGVVLSTGDEIAPEDVELDGVDPGSPSVRGQDLRSVLATLERELVERAVREHHGNLTAAATALGIDRNLLRYKLRKHGLRS